MAHNEYYLQLVDYWLNVLKNCSHKFKTFQQIHTSHSELRNVHAKSLNHIILSLYMII